MRNANKYDKRSRNPFALNPLAAGIVLMFAAGAANAQTAEPAKEEAAKKDAKAQQLEAVVVTGIRKGIEDAISVKRENSSIVEAISSEDIGKLPDTSIAESIARLPGLSAQRVAGRAQTISIRGLSGDFATTLLNGREQVSTGDNRAAEFDQYPSELLGGVVVYKTPDAALIGQGLSGTVDLQTVRPLNFSKRTWSVNLRGERNSLGSLVANREGIKATGNRFNGSWIDQFANNTFGIALGYSRQDNPVQVQRFESWGVGSGTLPSGQTVNAVNGGNFSSDVSRKQREGYLGVFEWKPNKDYSGLIDIYYSKFDDVTIKHGLQGGFFGGGIPSNIVLAGNFLQSFRGTGFDPVIRNDLETRKDNLFSFGWNNKVQFGGGWTFIADLSYSDTKRKDAILETYAGTTGVKGIWDISFDPITSRPNATSIDLNYGSPNVVKLTDEGGWGQDGFVKYPEVKDKLKAIRLEAKKDLGGAFSNVEFGVNYTDRTKSRESNEFFVDLLGTTGQRSSFPCCGGTRAEGPAVTVPADLLLPSANAGFTNLSVLNFDITGAFNRLYRLDRLVHPDVYQKDWTVFEKVSSAFAKFNIDTEVGSVPLRGNIGLNIQHTDQSSDAFTVGDRDPSRLLRINEGATYTNYLPSANLVFSFPEEHTLRLSAARTLARARLDQLKASRNLSVSNTTGLISADGGNTNLRPWLANAYDVSYEKYFGSRAYVGAAYFYKELSTYIQNGVDTVDFTGVPLPNNAVQPRSLIGNYTHPVNGQGGHIDGYEITASIPGSLMTSALDGFGFQWSYSDTNTNIRPSGVSLSGSGGGGIPNGGLPGLSRKVSNLTGYYENYGFQTRISARQRSDFLGEVQGFGADRNFVYIKGETVVDYQIGYEWQSGPVKGLSVLLQVLNINDAPYRRYDFNSGAPTEYTRYGRTYLLGLTYKM